MSIEPAARLVAVPPPRTATQAPALAMRGIRRSYGGAKVLDGVDLDVGAGEGVLVAGRNGAGKTTLLRVATRVIEPHAGSVRLFGQELEQSGRDYHRRLGFLAAGDRGIYARLSVRRNLEFWARIAFVPARRRGAAVARALERFHLLELADRRADRLSMGQRQRVRLAMTFLHDPELVLLDEPATSLDGDGLELLVEACEQLTRRGGAILGCAPSEDQCGFPLQRAYELRDGRLVEA